MYVYMIRYACVLEPHRCGAHGAQGLVKDTHARACRHAQQLEGMPWQCAACWCRLDVEGLLRMLGNLAKMGYSQVKATVGSLPR